jgi:hypothetical protein
MKIRFNICHSTRLDLLYKMVYLVSQFRIVLIIRQGTLYQTHLMTFNSLASLYSSIKRICWLWIPSQLLYKKWYAIVFECSNPSPTCYRRIHAKRDNSFGYSEPFPTIFTHSQPFQVIVGYSSLVPAFAEISFRFRLFHTIQGYSRPYSAISGYFQPFKRLGMSVCLDSYPMTFDPAVAVVCSGGGGGCL